MAEPGAFLAKTSLALTELNVVWTSKEKVVWVGENRARPLTIRLLRRQVADALAQFWKS